MAYHIFRRIRRSLPYKAKRTYYQKSCLEYNMFKVLLTEFLLIRFSFIKLMMDSTHSYNRNKKNFFLIFMLSISARRKLEE